MHWQLSAAGAYSIGFHSPTLVCQDITPLNSREWTFFQWMLVRRADLAASSDAYGDLPLGS